MVIAYLSKLGVSIAAMPLIAFICANKIGVGYSGNVAARVSGRRGGLVWVENFGAQLIGGGFCDLAASTLAANRVGMLSTHFCGFQRVRRSIVGLVKLVWFAQRRSLASLQMASPLMGNLQRLGALGAAGGVGAASDRPDRPRGATPSGRARCLDGLSLSCDREFSKKFTAAQPSRHFSRITLWLPQRDLADMRESYSVRPGSGVRVAREAAVTGRLTRRPKFFRGWRFAAIGVRVQRALSLAIGVTGTGKLCLRFGNVN